MNDENKPMNCCAISLFVHYETLTNQSNIVIRKQALFTQELISKIKGQEYFELLLFLRKWNLRLVVWSLESRLLCFA